MKTFLITDCGEPRNDILQLDARLRVRGIGNVVLQKNNVPLFDEDGNYHIQSPEAFEEEAKKVCQEDGFMIVMFVARLEVDEEELKRRFGDTFR